MKASNEQYLVHECGLYYWKRSVKKLRFALLLLGECGLELFKSLSYLHVYEVKKNNTTELEKLNNKYYYENGGY